MSEKATNVGGHYYPGIGPDSDFNYTSDCAYECGCWMGGSSSGGPDGVSPFGPCPNNPGGELAKPEPSAALADLTPETSVQPWTLGYPADPVPFGEMAALFGAAGTVLGFLQREGHFRVTRNRLHDRILECFPAREVAFRMRVALIIFQYFENHRADAANWDQDVEEYERKLKAGQPKVTPPTTWRGL